MKIFDSGNWKDEVCPVCGKQGKGKVALVAIDGTQEDNNEQAIPVHIDCLELRMNFEWGLEGLIYQKTQKDVEK
jgi:hypothetical protein